MKLTSKRHNRWCAYTLGNDGSHMVYGWYMNEELAEAKAKELLLADVSATVYVMKATQRFAI